MTEKDTFDLDYDLDEYDDYEYEDELEIDKMLEEFAAEDEEIRRMHMGDNVLEQAGVEVTPDTKK